MIRSGNHSSFPKVDEHPLDQQLRAVRAARERGRADDTAVDAAVDEVITVIVAQQSRAFIDVVTDGMVRWDGPLSHLAHHVDGLSLGEMVRWFDTNFHERRVVVEGPLRRRGPFLLHDYGIAAGVANRQLVKTVLPGPVTFARMSRDEHYRDPAKLAEAVAGVLADEVAELAAAGCRCFQLDEPLLCRHPADLELVARTAARVFEAAGPEATTIVSTYFGDLGALDGRLDALPGTHLGLELTAGSPNWGLLDRLPAGRGLVAGLFDARTTRQEDAADVAAALAAHRESLLSRDVIVGPNAGLELLPRNQAFDKLLHARYLVEQLSEEWAWPS